MTAKKMFLCISSAVVYLYGIMNATATLLYFCVTFGVRFI